jgi:hypothetical protein
MPLTTIPLPDRDIAVKRNAISVPSAYYWSIPVLLILVVLFVAWQGPSLWRDIIIDQHPVSLPDASVENGKCETRKGIFVDCEAHLVYNYNGRNYQGDVDMFFVDFHLGDYQTGVMISADRPELATLTIGIDKLLNRVLSLAGMVVILGGAVVGAVFALGRTLRSRARLGRPDRLVTVPVVITALKKQRGGFFITYSDGIGDKKKGRIAHTQLDAGEEPLLVGMSKTKKPVALAVRHGNTALPVLLDRRLERLELTEAERRTALEPFAARMASVPSVAAFAPKRGRSLLRGVVTFFATILLIVVAACGYWVWYVTSADSAFNTPGMEINSIMPEPLNKWGCDQLKQRFGNGGPPEGCVAGDYTNWK